jgi:hypothetical protein
MKTSNKFLIIALAIILTGTVLVILKVKQFVVGERIELSGTTIEKVHEISDFENLNVSGAMDLQIVKSDVNKLTLEADTSILRLVKISQSGNMLTIKMNSSFNKHVKVQGTLQAKDFNFRSLNISAGAEVATIDTITSPDIKISLSAGGHANLPLSCNSVDCSASAGAGANLSGKTKDLNTDASAGAQIIAEKLIAENARAEASAGGYILINVSNSLDVSCSAGGSVKYFGQPDMKNIDISSGGNLSKAN